MGKDKPSIKQYVERRYGYNLDFTLDEIRDTYEHSEASQDTVPQAIVAFLEGLDFEDVIRNAVSIGGDSDTISAIAGSIAEAYYGIPDHIHDRTLRYVPKQLLEIVGRFNESVKAKNVVNSS
jgi:ADP-ribosylglycohydrolase